MLLLAFQRRHTNVTPATTASTYDRDVATLQGVGWQFSGNHYKE